MADDHPIEDLDIARKYMLDHERREKKIAELLSQAEDLRRAASNTTDQAETIHYEVQSIRKLVEAIMASFQIGEPDPEDEPPRGT